MLYNLAGNTMIREIAEGYALSGRPYDEREVMEAYLAAWLERETKTDGRPSAVKPAHLDLYMQLLEGVAAKYLDEDRLDEQGCFSVRYDDVIRASHEGRELRFPAFRILNRSGLKYLDPREPGSRKYRFEPVWLHRLLVEKYSERRS
jgi:hypothetical protein